MKNRTVLILGILLLVFIGVSYAYHQYSVREQARQEALLEAQRYQQNLQSFEAFLNGFLENVYQEVLAYKQRKQVLISLVKPENLRSAEYVAENEMIGESTIMAMQLQMDRIMSLFEQADEAFSELVKEFPDDQQNEMRERWAAELDKQTTIYVSYFEHEQTILNAYRELLGLYTAKREAMSIDLANKKIMFTNLEDQALENQIKRRIAEAQTAQREIMQSKREINP